MRKDWFDTIERLRTFLKDHCCYLAEEKEEIIGFAVVERNGVMIRLLIRPDYRGKGLGKKLLKISNPQIIRSKTDQSTGDPSGFYEKFGFKKIGSLVGRKKNIQLMIKSTS